MKNIKIGDLVEMCSLMPGVVMNLDGDDATIRSLEYDDYESETRFSSCSLGSCGVRKLTALDVRMRLSLGKEKLIELYGEAKQNFNGDYEDYDKLIKNNFESGL